MPGRRPAPRSRNGRFPGGCRRSGLSPALGLRYAARFEHPRGAFVPAGGGSPAGPLPPWPVVGGQPRAAAPQ